MELTLCLDNDSWEAQVIIVNLFLVMAIEYHCRRPILLSFCSKSVKSLLSILQIEEITIFLLNYF